MGSDANVSLLPHRELFDTFRSLWRHPRAKRNEVAAFQTRKLRVLVDHAYRRVPFYRRLLDNAGVGPQDIRRIEDLSLLPITSSKVFKARPMDDILTKGVKAERLMIHRTSGSQGRPFNVRRNYWEEHLLNMFRIRAMRQSGLRLWDRIANVAVTEGLRPKPDLRVTFPRRLRQALGVYRQYPLNCMQPEAHLVKALGRLQPDIICGYPVVLSHLAQTFQNSRPFSVFPRVVFTGGESLTPYRRQIIGTGFEAEVFDFYGANECNLAAWECPNQGCYHVCDDNIILEIIRNGRPAEKGEKGEVVITCLHAYAMPFIRYSLGDIAEKGDASCRCGQPFSTLKKIEGRADDYLHLPGGRSIYPDEIVIPALIGRKRSWVMLYQLVQEKLDRVDLDIEVLRPPAPEEVEHMKKAAQDILGPEVEFRLRVVDRIAFERSGKFRIRRSLVKSDFDS